MELIHDDADQPEAYAQGGDQSMTNAERAITILVSLGLPDLPSLAHEIAQELDMAEQRGRETERRRIMQVITLYAVRRPQYAQACDDLLEMLR